MAFTVHDNDKRDSVCLALASSKELDFHLLKVNFFTTLLICFIITMETS